MSVTSLTQDATEERRASLYVIPAADPEKERLRTQYAFKKMLFGWNEPIPHSVDITNVNNILDVAAGTLAWTLDIASMSHVRRRLAKPNDDSGHNVDGIHLFACDIETRFFPDKDIIGQLGITAFQHDATQPFPADLHDKFDLVHVSFLFLCLTQEGWKSALRNCYEVLKPGGTLLIDEADPVMYSEMASAPAEDAVGHDLDKCLSAPGWLSNANRIYTAFALENGFFVDMTFRLSNLLREAGFEVVDTKRVVAPSGRACHTLRPDRTEHGFEEFSVENITFIFEHLAAALFAKGKLCNNEGTAVTSLEEMKSMVAGVKEGLRQEGGFSFGRYCVARKTQA
ncbi:hypothetical protein ACG7TL_008576 [Trametes sanguinea]